MYIVCPVECLTYWCNKKPVGFKRFISFVNTIHFFFSVYSIACSDFSQEEIFVSVTIAHHDGTTLQIRNKSVQKIYEYLITANISTQGSVNICTKTETRSVHPANSYLYNWTDLLGDGLTLFLFWAPQSPPLKQGRHK